MNEKEIEAYYDKFLESRMLKYRIYGNKRIDLAIERIKKFIKAGDNVLDVGCGIGIVSEAISEAVGPTGQVWAFDISDRNIWYSQESISKDNVTLFKADAIKEQEKIRKKITSENIDVVLLVDVIEHIPKAQHVELFNFLKLLCSKQAYFVLTYPSPQFQRYLIDEKPDKLQIIDQVIEFDYVQTVIEETGLSIKHYSLERVWMQNQYVHCVLQTDNSLKKTTTNEKLSFIHNVKNRIRSYFNTYLKFPYKKYKYINSIFNK